LSHFTLAASRQVVSFVKHLDNNAMAGVFRPGATAVISGGASGVGFAFAQLGRRHGMNLALLDLNRVNLQKAGDALKPKNNEKTDTYPMDVSSVSDWSNVKADVESKFGSVDLLMLNAGASFRPEGGKQWEDPDYFHQTFCRERFRARQWPGGILAIGPENKAASVDYHYREQTRYNESAGEPCVQCVQIYGKDDHRTSGARPAARESPHLRPPSDTRVDLYRPFREQWAGAG
jgi:hypothetical protein